jgi:hypothetical protein
VTVGAKLKVAGKRNGDSSITARKVEIVLPALHGYIRSINGNTLVVSGHTVLLTANTGSSISTPSCRYRRARSRWASSSASRGQRTATAA